MDVRPFISEPLADDALHRFNRTLAIIHAVGFPRVVAELVLRKVAVQVMFGTMLVHATHTPFEDRERAFNRVGVDGAIFRVHVLKAGVGKRQAA